MEQVCSIKLCGMKASFSSSDTFVFLCIRHKLLFAKELNATLCEKIAQDILAECQNRTWKIYSMVGSFEETGCMQSTGEDGDLLACSHHDDAARVRSFIQ